MEGGIFIALPLAIQIKKKKVAILDFSDLSGTQSQLGRYIAEELSVHLVEKRLDFSVMDRANLKTILAEHKLTIEGLIEPENAKKLGQFSGVDAIILGSATEINNGTSITVKIIATDTAEIVGAAKTQVPGVITFNNSSGISQGVPIPSEVKNSQVNSQITSEKPSTDTFQRFDELELQFVGLRLLGRELSSYKIKVDLTLKNTSTEATLYVALKASSSLTGSFIDSENNSYEAYSSEIKGIGWGYNSNASWTEIDPGKTIRISIIYFARDPPHPGVSFELQNEILFGSRSMVRENTFKSYNLLIKIPATGAARKAEKKQLSDQSKEARRLFDSRYGVPASSQPPSR